MLFDNVCMRKLTKNCTFFLYFRLFVCHSFIVWWTTTSLMHSQPWNEHFWMKAVHTNKKKIAKFYRIFCRLKIFQAGKNVIMNYRKSKQSFPISFEYWNKTETEWVSNCVFVCGGHANWVTWRKFIYVLYTQVWLEWKKKIFIWNFFFPTG